MALDNLEATDIFFEKILHRGLRDETIRNVVLAKKESATTKGENFLSSLTRLTLRYTCSGNHDNVDKTAHVILKEEPVVSESSLENIREMNVFNTERQLLEEILPKIEDSVGRRLGPKVYYSSIEPQIIVMEDIAVEGFKNLNRIKGFNRDQTLMVLERLAEFHAGSVLFNEQNPGWMQRFTRGLVSSDMPPLFFKMMQAAVVGVVEEIRNWPDKFVAITEKLEKISEEVIERMKEVTKYEKDEFCVLNHGDLWVNNLMFKNDEDGNPRDLRIIDYQFVVWSSPAVDLLYFLNAAPESNLKGTNDDLFLKKYLTHLSVTMKKIGCTSKPPTMDQLKMSMYKRRILPIVCTLHFLPIMIAEGGEVKTIEDIFYTERHDVRVFQNKSVKLLAEKMLPIFNERGYLD